MCSKAMLQEAIRLDKDVLERISVPLARAEAVRKRKGPRVAGPDVP